MPATYRKQFLKQYKLEDKPYGIDDLSRITGIPQWILKEVESRGLGAYYNNYQSVREKGTFKKGTNAPPNQKLSPQQWSSARIYSFIMKNPRHDTDLRALIDVKQTVTKPTVPTGYDIRVSTRPHKKYDVFYQNKYLLSFGDKRYGQYRDVTPIGAYRPLDHNDKQRRTNYYTRHGPADDKNSAKWWSHRFLWPLR